MHFKDDHACWGNQRFVLESRTSSAKVLSLLTRSPQKIPKDPFVLKNLVYPYGGVTCYKHVSSSDFSRKGRVYPSVCRLAPSLFRQSRKIGKKGKLGKGKTTHFVHCFRQTYYRWRKRLGVSLLGLRTRFQHDRQETFGLDF